MLPMQVVVVVTIASTMAVEVAVEMMVLEEAEGIRASPPAVEVVTLEKAAAGIWASRL
jgi:hypothetical protein